MANWWDKNLTDKQKFRLQEPKDPSLLDVVSTVPNPVGDVASGLLAAQDFSKGNYGTSALNALGLLPFVPSMGGVVKNIGKEVNAYPLAPAGTRYEEYSGNLTYMTPDEYLRNVRPLTLDESSLDNIADLKRHVESGGKLDPLAIYPSGKEDGRHRAYLAKELGINQVPVALHGRTKYEIQQATAQKNAALPISEGGLGLPANNTAMDRAKALGFDVNSPVYHGTDKSFDAFDLNKIGSQTSMPLNFPKGIYTSPNVEVSLNYGKGEGQNVIPLLMNKQNPISITDDITSAEAFKRFNAGDVDTFLSKNVAVAKNPNQLRSINAAFDPFRRNEADILAGVGVGVPVASGLLDIENKKVPNKEKKKTK